MPLELITPREVWPAGTGMNKWMRLAGCERVGSSNNTLQLAHGRGQDSTVATARMENGHSVRVASVAMQRPAR